MDRVMPVLPPPARGGESTPTGVSEMGKPDACFASLLLGEGVSPTSATTAGDESTPLSRGSPTELLVQAGASKSLEKTVVIARDDAVATSESRCNLSSPLTEEEEERLKQDDESAGDCVKMFSLPQACVSRIIGPSKVTLAGLKALHSCHIAINQETRDKGYSVCTIRAKTDEHVDACKNDIDKLSAESRAHSVKEVQIPQKYVGMIIGASGATLAKIRKHTNAEINVVQDTANEGYSVAHVSGSLDAVDKTVDVISKMVVSGRQASEGYQEYLRNVQSGTVAALPFKPDKMPGLEFLEDEDPALLTPKGSKGGKSGGWGTPTHSAASSSGGSGYNAWHANNYGPSTSGGSFDWGAGRKKGGFVGGGVGIKGGSGKGIQYVDAAAHRHSDTFEVPQHYVGLLVGKQGEAIRRFRQFAAERDMAIRVKQENNMSAATVVLTGNDVDELASLKADMTQNLFQAIAKLDADKGGKGKSKGKGKEKGYFPEVFYGDSGKNKARSGPYDGGKGYGDVQSGSQYNDSDWWANVFTQVLQHKNSPQQKPQPPANNSWGSNDLLSSLLGTQPQQSSNQNWGSQQSSQNWGGQQSNQSWGGQQSGSGQASDENLHNALSALLGNGGGW